MALCRSLLLSVGVQCLLVVLGQFGIPPQGTWGQESKRGPAELT